MTLRVHQTSPASSWRLFTPGQLPFTFKNNRFPKAIMLNAVGTVQLIGRDGNSVSFTPAEGVPIPVRPETIQSSTVDVICLWD